MHARKHLLTLMLPLAMMIGGSWGAYADETLVHKKNIDVGGQGLGAFDISFVDPTIELYSLSDRTNASIDLFDSHVADFIGRVGTVCPSGNPAPHFCFQGVVLVNGTPDNDLSGPDGNVTVGNTEIWAGDGDSRIKVINIATRTFETTISTGGKFRVDEMAYDPRDHLLAAANDADSPPFITIFDTTTKTIKRPRLFFQKGSPTANVDATAGIEQTQWSPDTGMFYTSIPQIGSDPSIGGVSIIDPSTMKVTGTFLVRNCSPAGLALGPHHEALVGCSAAFGSPAFTRSLIIDITSTDFTVDGAVVARVAIGGSDQVWYDPGTKHYFLAARSNLNSTGTADPILGAIDAVTHKVDASTPSSLTSHSVAADAFSHFVFLPAAFLTPTSPPDPNNPCPHIGCVAVYIAAEPPTE